MKVIANIKCRNGDPAHPFGLHPQYAKEGAAWVQPIASAYAAAGCDVMLDMPAGSPPGVIYAASQWRPLSPDLRADLMKIGSRLRRDGRRFGLYTGGHFDSTPKTIEADGEKYGSSLSSTKREEWADLFETVNDAFDFLFIDHISELHRQTEGKGPYWMDKIAAKSERFGQRLTVGGEAFLMTLRDNVPHFDRPAMKGRPFCALLPWIEKYGYRPDPGEDHWVWLNGETNLHRAAAWWTPEAADELLERVRAAGFSQTIVDVWDTKPERVAWVRRFCDG